MKTLGVIGGLGPMATAYFLELVTQMTDAAIDQEHLDIIIHSRPSTPDRTSFILGNSTESPLPSMLAVGKELVQLGVSCISIPCITSHHFYQEMQDALSVPILHIVRETAAHLKEQGISCAGIMATSGTVHSNLFQQALTEAGMSFAVPSDVCQEYVMDLIYKDVKAGREPKMKKFLAVKKELQENGAEAFILGCTELSVIKKSYEVGPSCVDAMEVLARQSVLACGKPIRKEYGCLLTG